MQTQIAYSHRVSSNQQHQNPSLSNSKCSRQNSHRKYLEVVSKESLNQKCIQRKVNLCASCASLPGKHYYDQSFSNNQRRCARISHTPSSLSRAHSQMINPRLSQSRQRITIKQIIREVPVPVKISYQNPSPLKIRNQNNEVPKRRNQQNPQFYEQLYQPQSKAHFLMLHSQNQKPLTIIHQQTQIPLKMINPPKEFKSPQEVNNFMIVPPRNSFTINEKISIQRNPPDQNMNNLQRKQPSIGEKQNFESRKFLSNQSYINQQIKISEYLQNPAPQFQIYEKVQKYRRSEDRQPAKRVNTSGHAFELDKNCICHKIEEITNSACIKRINQDSSQRKSLIY